MMAPISPGWYWGQKGWGFNSDTVDERDHLTRTSEEIRKSLESTVDFLAFTTKSERLHLGFSTFFRHPDKGDE